MIQILFQDDHRERAESLQDVTRGSQCAEVTTAASAANIDTLVFWGHGTKEALCGLSARELYNKIKEWRGKNPTLSTVGIVTCNGRHCDGHSIDYVSKLKYHLSGRSSLAGKIKLKALPTSALGVREVWSILKWEPTTKTWAYVTARSVARSEYTGPNNYSGPDTRMMDVCSLVDNDYEKNGKDYVTIPIGKTGKTRFKTKSYKGSLVTKAQQVLAEHQNRNSPFYTQLGPGMWTIDYGDITTLIGFLVDAM